LGANIKAMPASLMQRSIPAAGSARSTPSVSSTSAEPHLQTFRGCGGCGGCVGVAEGATDAAVHSKRMWALLVQCRAGRRVRRVREGAGRAHGRH
jgi:hypothetical protein